MFYGQRLKKQNWSNINNYLNITNLPSSEKLRANSFWLTFLVGFKRARQNVPEFVGIPDQNQLRGNGAGGFDPEIANPENTVEQVLVRGVVGDAREGNDHLALTEDSLLIHQAVLINVQPFRKVRDDAWVDQRPPAYDRFE